ncbi:MULTISPECIES: 3-dehydroquinate synthase [Cetobacterium]|uniref:3-dehydroquinate synthase n=1 Tax=Candidatus Cetobacterium colombiensis TaxID=3073100 RepID=A0ABU4W8I9_9FUSO|nr:3-dehydroquinate synthase [Candidatus Cetobacterium colombiensis]MDX8335554.1 3-dehydroquinate synthase [Candidatus Cetobacterium colombiensis]
MKNLVMKTSINSYDILIGQNTIDRINEFTENYDKILLLTNKTIGNLYGNKILSKLPKKKTYRFEIEDGEMYKNMETSMEIFSFLIENNFSRNSLIICVGGGVVCDLGGFIASTFMRGLDFLQVPTSLLAQVDASIGGKVAINHPLGKNLIGSFKQPIGVIIDIDFLKTLPQCQFKSGMGEVIKHSIISKDKNYFKFLIESNREILKLKPEVLIEMIYESCKIKKEFVEKDEFEKGDRAFLNLGHTYAHALETLFDYQHISHGEAVAKGVIFELQISKLLGFATDEYIKSIRDLFSMYKIDSTPIYINDETLINVMKKDKKNSNDKIKFIIDKNGALENLPVTKEIISEVNNLFKNRILKGVIDIGTNSCRLFIAEVEKSENKINIIAPLFKDLEVSRLGKNLNQTGVLSKESIEKTYEIIKKFKEKTDSMGVTELIAFATAATREASNGSLFVQGIKNEFDINTLVIPGEIEAKLSFNGNSNIYREKIATIDVGGGSSEITIGNYNSIDYVKSFPIGVVKLTEMFFADENYNEETLLSARNYLKGFFNELSKFGDCNFKIIGVAGTVTTNVSVTKRLPKFIESEINGYNLSKIELEENLFLFLNKNLDDRKKIIGLEPNRADVIIAGNLILITLLEILNKTSITVSTVDNLEGGMVLNI